ncbi:MAG TPA: hypothetical protein VE821_03865 [Pyrinomonadaceae bacterium]|nr:hypothetical protein [Pyrinomonadaceae bacterium]
MRKSTAGHDLYNTDKHGADESPPAYFILEGAAEEDEKIFSQ